MKFWRTRKKMMTVWQAKKILSKVRGVEVGSNVDGDNVLYFQVSKKEFRDIISGLPDHRELFAQVVGDWLRVG
jgi:hypothetical protein